ncbi:MAG: hypothetical protein LBH20_03625 [Treponema sp.]|jgi:hypothetical protein|nr:hypothetical protein [Treponema sp.]
MRNLIDRVMLWLAPDGVGGGSAEGGDQQPANADLLSNVFAGGEGGKPAAKPDGDKPEGDTAAGGTNAGSEPKKLAPWTEQLPPEMRDNPQLAAKLAGFTKLGDMAKAYLELEGKTTGGAAGVAIPGKDATPEAVAEFWEKAGRPKSADGYSFAADKDHDGASFAQAAFAANLTEAQAKAMLSSLNEIGAQKAQAFREDRQRQMAETSAALEKEYGSRYGEQIELLKRGLANAGPNVAQILAQAGLSGNPEIVKAFIAYGKMTAESGASRGGEAGASLKSVSEGGSLSFKDT